MCKDCSGSQICEHGKQRTVCKECGGSQICEHSKLRYRCKECGGGSICEHHRLRNECKECCGSQICEHSKARRTCADCDGSKICKSRREPHNTGCRTIGNRKLNGFCTHCFAKLFPTDPRTLSIRKKSKEIQVVSHLACKYD